jgi:hypothetical protein
MATRGEFDVGSEANTAVFRRGVSPERELTIAHSNLNTLCKLKTVMLSS